MTLTREDLVDAAPADFWVACRDNGWQKSTAGLCRSFVQANLVVLPKSDAFDFLRFCQRNPKPCPVMEVLDPGDPQPRATAPGADIRTDLGRYSVYRNGRLDVEVDDINHLWTGEMTAFLLGCSFSFEYPLRKAGLPVRHVEQGTEVPVFRTNRECAPAGPFAGHLVVSMRAMPGELVAKAVEITAAHPEVHGAPVHVGAPEQLGIGDIARPDWGEPVQFCEGDVPMFWACGVTAQQVALESAPPLMITHSGDCMFMTNIPLE